MIDTTIPVSEVNVDGTALNLALSTETLRDFIYPINSIYLSVNNISPAQLFGGTWEALSEGYALWTTTTEGTGGQIIDAGLPNITGMDDGGLVHSGGASRCEGAFTEESYENTVGAIGSGNVYGRRWSSFSASNGETKMDGTLKNDVYGKSDTVQPPAIRVFAWRRTA